jgi:hypothetical protein
MSEKEERVSISISWLKRRVGFKYNLYMRMGGLKKKKKDRRKRKGRKLRKKSRWFERHSHCPHRFVGIEGGHSSC